jgi:alkaline phosphatase D
MPMKTRNDSNRSRAKQPQLTRREALSAPAVLLWAGQAHASAPDDPPWNAMGERVGEVTNTSAIVHTRLTELPKRNDNGYAYPCWSHALSYDERDALGIPPGLQIRDLQGACPGKAGRVRLHYGVESDLRGAQTTGWSAVGSETDFTHKFVLRGLQSGRRYYYSVEIAGLKGAVTRRGRIGTFATAPEADHWQPTRFFLITCQDYNCRDHPLGGFRIYEAMARLGGDFLLSNGDNVYYDIDVPVAKTVDLARHHWHRMYSQPLIMDLLYRMPAYWQKDDHDSFEDDDWPQRPPQRVKPMTYRQLAPVFAEQVPVGERMYRAVRWGKGLELFLVENRDFRSPNPMPDGPDKTIWGKEQFEWLKKSILQSDAQYRILVSPDAIVGPSFQDPEFRYPQGGGDCHADAAFGHEGNAFRQWVKNNHLTNFFVINGDRHWQYHSVDPDTGIREFGCGAATDTHSQSPPTDPRYHKFLRPKGGFLSLTLDGTESRPELTVRFHDVHGKVLKEFPITR